MYNPYNDATPATPPASTHTLPTRCPSCRSLAISTSARAPDEHAYWRCGGCGEVWNATRRDAARNTRPTWR
jgi:transposase-like protein